MARGRDNASDPNRRSRVPARHRLLSLLAVAGLVLALAPPVAAQDGGGPVLDVRPPAAAPGDQILISGRDFEDPCVELYLGEVDSSNFLTAPPVDDGSFEAELQVPALAQPGETSIIATRTGLFCDGEPTGTRVEVAFEVLDPGPYEPDLVPRFVPTKRVLEPGDLDGTGFSRTEAHLKFVQDSTVRLGDDGTLVDRDDPDDEQLAQINDLLDAASATVERLFSQRAEQDMDREKALLERSSGREQGDKNLYFQLTYPVGTDDITLLNTLNAFDLVELAYAEPMEGEDPVSHAGDFRGAQGYRVAAPGGIHADAARAIAGGRGENVQIIDIERWFNPDHEDLPTVTVYDNGDPLAAFTAPFDHGTAVMGQLFGLDNDRGVLGIADQADAAFVSSAGGRPNAIDVATANSDPGDVILLELQRGGPNGTCSNATTPPQLGCVPEEYVQASYDAIVSAVAAGMIVVAAAGNGFQDLNDAVYADEFGDGVGARPDSGAIIVGAGAADTDAGVWGGPTPGACVPRAPARSRLGFSNHGDRVNVQGWGECVTTTGYGNLLGAPDSDDAYSGFFGGTSSASPIVAGAAGILSSVAQAEGNANGLTSTEARAILMATGTAQEDLTNPTPGFPEGNIGPLPNLAAALGLVLEADLVVTKSASEDPVAAGTSFTYTIEVENLGPEVAIDVVAIDTLPSQIDLDGPLDDRCAVVAGTVRCELGDLAVGETETVKLDVAVPASLVHDNQGPVTVTNEVTVSSETDDPVPGNDTASVDTEVVAVADLEVLEVSLSQVPAQALIGVDLPVTVTSDVVNGGPSSPMDATLTVSATASAGASAGPDDDDPGSPLASVDAVTGTAVEVEQDLIIRCEAPGPQQVVIEVELEPASGLDSDPDQTNNTGTVTVEFDCVTPIAINIRPANEFNRLNLGSAQRVPVAALTTEAGEYDLPVGFDAAWIVPETVRFGTATEVWDGTGGAPYHTGVTNLRDSFELDDRTKDGDLDLVGGFVVPLTGLQLGDTEACMAGEYELAGQRFAFFGCDRVAVR